VGLARSGGSGAVRSAGPGPRGETWRSPRQHIERTYGMYVGIGTLILLILILILIF
jgi:hypothetical protein